MKHPYRQVVPSDSFVFTGLYECYLPVEGYGDMRFCGSKEAFEEAFKKLDESMKEDEVRK